MIRHAEAAPLGEGGVTDDANRPLTPKGEQQARSVAAGLQQRGVMLDRIICSPLLRARQTAEGLVQAWSKPAPELRVCEELAPGGKRKRVARFLKRLACDKVAVVGHQPDLDLFAAWLIGSRRARLNLAKAGVAYIRCDGDPGKGDGELIWMAPPEFLGS